MPNEIEFRCMNDCKHTEKGYKESPCNKCKRNGDVQKQLSKDKKVKGYADYYRVSN